VFHQPPLLSVCYDSSLFVFQFCEAVWLWMLLTDSGDELCDLLPALLWGMGYHPPTLHLRPFQFFLLLIVPAEISSLSSPFLQCTFSLPTSSAVVLDYSSVHCLLLFSLFGGGISLPRGYAGFSWGWLGEFHMVLTCLFC
jgi:hypothetical protein